MTLILGHEKPPIDEALEHYGIRGMHWGIRKKEETSGEKSVNEEIQAKRDRKAQKHLDIAADLQKQIDEAKAKKIGASQYKKNVLNIRIQNLSEERKGQLRDAEAKRQGKLSRGERNALIIGGVLAAYGAYKFVDSGQLHELSIKGKQFLNGANSPIWKKNELLSKANMSIDEIKRSVMKPINPGYGLPGTKMNCRRCTFAYEMRRRGYDVAATHSISGTGQSAGGLFRSVTPGAHTPTSLVGTAFAAASDGPFKQFFSSSGGGLGRTKINFDELKGSYLKDLKGYNGDFSRSGAIFRALGTQPNGARGELGVSWRAGGAHSLAWEIINGKPVVFDNQSGRIYSDSFQFGHAVGDMVLRAGFTRLDNLELNEAFLRRWLRNA